VVASDITVLREVGGSAAHYCPSGDVAAWTRAVEALIQERQSPSASLLARQVKASSEQASRFSLENHLTGTMRVYEEVTGSTWPSVAAERSPGQAVPVPI
jgi:hypothetical protein